MRRALNERRAKLDYIAGENPWVVEGLDTAIEQQVDRLADYPLVGRTGRARGTRELVIARTSFVVIYRINRNRIDILRLLHGAQNWPPPGH